MAISDDLQDEWTQHQIDLLRVSASLRKDVVEELIKLESYLTTELQAADLTVNKASKMEALLSQTQKQIQGAYTLIGSNHQKDLHKLADLESKQAVKVTNAQIGADVLTVKLSPKQLEALVDGKHIFGASSKDWWNGQSADLQAKFATAMRQGVLLGESVDELAKRVRGTKANGYNDGLMALKKREAEALVRSSVISISNEARLRTYEEMGDVAKGIQWVATLDTRTTEICRALDGKAWTLKDRKPIGHDKKFPGPTAHWNCRSTQIVVMKSWDELSGKKLPSVGNEELQAKMAEKLKAKGWSDEKIAKALPGMRASMDGQTAKETTFNDWLKRKSDAQVNKMLGPGRAELWKTGKLTVSDMTDQNNRPLTLKQLEAKITKGIPAPETLGVQYPPSRPAAKFDGKTPEQIAQEVAEALAAEAKAKAAETAAAFSEAAAYKFVAGNPTPQTLAMISKLEHDDPAVLAFQQKTIAAKAENDASDLLLEFQKKSPLHKQAADEALNARGERFDTNVAQLKLATKIANDLAAAEINGLATAGNLVEKAKAKALIKAGKTTPEDLQSLKAAVEESKANAAKNAALTGAKKNLVAGKKLTSNQTLAVDGLDPDEATAFHGEVETLIEAAKLKAAAEAAAKAVPAMTGPDLKVANLDVVPPNAGTLKLETVLPGSTAPGLYTDTSTGKKWVIKKASGTSLAHVENEAMADAIYRAAGMKVPASVMMDFNGQKVKAAEYLTNTLDLAGAKALSGPKGWADLKAKAQSGFVMDALMGNWDAVGTGKNNMLVNYDDGDSLWRIDNGGALAYRAMGAKKDPKWMGAEVKELKSLLDPKINKDAAEVYAGISKAEINRQIAEISSRKAAILAAATDPDVRAFLQKRIAWLEDQLPSEMRAVASTPSVLPVDVADRIAKARAAGWAAQTDGPQIEDNNVLFWRESHGGDAVTRANLKVTAAGSEAIIEKLKAAGADMGAASSTSAPTKPTHPADNYWTNLQIAAKHIGAHAKDGVYNAAKLDALAKAKADLQKVKGSKTPGMKEMAEHYLEMIETLEKAKDGKTTPSKFFNQFEWKPAAPVAGPVVTPAAALPGWSVKRSDQWNTYTATPDKDGVLVRQTSPNMNVNVGRGWEMTKGNVTVRFADFDGKSGSKTYWGVVEVSVKGDSGGPGAQQAMDALSELGLDTTPTPKPFQELLYLHKGFYLHNKHTSPAYAAIYHDPALPVDVKISKIKDLAEREFNVKLPRTEAGWNEDYNPLGRTAADGSGYRFFDRWDIPRSKMEKEMKNWQLHHSLSGSASDVVGSFLDRNLVTTTFDRIRTGVSVGQTGGASSSADMGTGGAVHYFTNVVGASKTNPGLRFKIRNLARLDVVSHHRDTYGAFSAYSGRVATVDEYKRMNKVSITQDNALLKGGLNFLEEIDQIIVRTPAERNAVLAEFKKRGIVTLPDGRTVESIVIKK